jgi:hypothetical protein
MVGGTRMRLSCEHFDVERGGCNKCKYIRVDDRYETIAHYIRVSDWCVVDGEVRCPDHK